MAITITPTPCYALMRTPNNAIPFTVQVFVTGVLPFEAQAQNLTFSTSQGSTAASCETFEDILDGIRAIITDQFSNYSPTIDDIQVGLAVPPLGGLLLLVDASAGGGVVISGVNTNDTLNVAGNVGLTGTANVSVVSPVTEANRVQVDTVN